MSQDQDPRNLASRLPEIIEGLLAQLERAVAAGTSPQRRQEAEKLVARLRRITASLPNLVKGQGEPLTDSQATAVSSLPRPTPDALLPSKDKEGK